MTQLFDRFRSSLSLQLVTTFVLVTLVLIVLLQAVMQAFLLPPMKGRGEAHLMRYALAIADEIGRPPNVRVAEHIVNELPVDIRIKMPNMVWENTHNWPHISRFRDEQRLADGSVIASAAPYRDRLVIRFVSEPFEYWVAVRHDWHTRGLIALILTITLAVAALFILFDLMRRRLRPIAIIGSGIERIGKGDLSHRIAVDTRNEFGELAGRINAMAEQLEHMLEAKRELLLALSHELRSPLARARLAAEMLPEGRNQQSVINSIARMETLITDLTEIERLRSTHAPLRKTSARLDELLANVIAEHFPSAAITIVAKTPLPPCDVDVTRMQLCLKNVVDNAIEHHFDDTRQVTISCTVDTSHIIIVITNYGIGCTPKEMAKFTEPFYRADSARGHQRQGFGLGLYLCSQIMQAHGGTLVYSSDGVSSVTATITLPLAKQQGLS